MSELHRRMMRRIPGLACTASGALGLLALAGWTFDVEQLRSGLSGLPPMMPTTAIGLLLASSAFWVLRKTATANAFRFSAYLGAAAVSMLGVVTLSEYLSGFDTGIHHLFFAPRTMPLATPVATRPWPLLGLSFLLLGCALFCLHRETRRGHRPAEWFALLSLLLSLLVLLIYSFAALPALSPSVWSGMALPTATAIFVLSVGVLFVDPDRGLMAFLIVGDSAGSVLLRRLLPAVILTPILLNALRTYAEMDGLSRVGSALQTVASISVFTALTWWNCRVLHHLDKERNKATAELWRSRDELEEKVHERTRRLQTTIESRESAMEALKFGGDRTRSIVDNVVDGIIAVDPTGIIQAANPAAERIFGYSQQELTGQNVSILMAEPHRTAINEHIAQNVRTGEAKSIGVGREVPGIRRDGAIFPMELSVGEFGQIGQKFYSIVVRDITERKNAEESHSLARTVLDSLASHIAVLDESGTIVAVNRSWRMFADANGGAGRVCEGTNYLQVCDSATGESREIATAFANGIRRVLTGHQASFELEYPCHSPSQRSWYMGRVHPFAGRGGPRRVVVGHENITAHKTAEEHLRDRERMLARSQKMAHVGSWELDIYDRSDWARNVLRWSDECFRIFGYEPGQVLVTQALFFEAVRPDDRQPIMTAMAGLLSGGGTYEIEHHIARPDGSERVIKQWAEVDTDSNLYPTRILGTCQDITERRAAEQALRISEERLAMATESAGLGTYDTDLIAVRSIWSSRQEELFGFAPGEFDGTFNSFIKRVHPDDRDGLERAVVLARSNHELYHHEYRTVSPDGTVRWIASFGRNNYNESGMAVRMAGVTQDITERKRIEQALLRSESSLAEAQRFAHMGSWNWDIASDVLNWSDEHYRIFGLQPGEMVMTFDHGARYLHPEDLIAVRARIEQAFRDQEPYECSLRVHRDDGTERVIWSRGQPVYDESGKPVRMFGTIQDITEKMLADEMLQASERKFRAVFEGALDAMTLQDDDCRIVDANAAACTLFGLPHDQLIGKILDEFVEPGFDMARARAEYRNAGTAQGQFRLVRGDGTSRDTEYTAKANIVPDRHLTILRDVTERKRADEALLESEEFSRQVIADLQEGVFVLDRNLRYVIRNRFQEELSGVTIEQAIGKHPDDFFPFLREQGIVALFERALAGESVVAPDIAITAPFATREVWVTVRAVPHRNARGELVGVIGTTQDVSERKRAEDALRSYVLRLENLRGFDQAILSAHSPQGLAEAALRQLEALLPIWAGGVIVFTADPSQIEALAGVGHFCEIFPLGKRVSIDLADNTDLPALRAGKTSSCVDVEGIDYSRRPIMEKFRAAGMRSYLFVPLIDRGELLGTLNVGSDRPGAFTSEHVEIAREVCDHLAIALSQAFLFEENNSSKKRLESLSRQLIRAEEEERRRIARELHDEIGQALTALKINLQEVVSGSGSVQRLLAESVGIVEQLLQQVRGMALDLRPSLLDDLGLAAALQWYVRRQSERTGILGRFVADPDPIKADPEIVTACFRVAQEALTNVARHARASRFSVELLQHSGGLQLVVRDDGVGFDTDGAFDAAVLGNSFGLAGMRERVELVGGKIAFISAPAVGTEVHVDFPNPPLGSLDLRRSSPPFADIRQED